MSAVVRRTVQNGIVLVGSDGHYWPGVPVPAHDAFVDRCADLRKRWELAGVIYDGDAIDGARISRHSRIGWEKRPLVHEELAEVDRRLGAITCASKPPRAKRLPAPFFDWPMGNHDMRYENTISAAAPEYESVPGMHLKDHFPEWTPCWSVLINGHVLVKHRMAGGVHARYTNVSRNAVTVVTAHTHRLGVTPYTDATGTRWGCETGMLGNRDGPQFENYTESNPTNWQMGWLELEFIEGELQWPKTVWIRG